ncbi:tRNA-specific adenosine deaminase 2 [Nematocida major]|uniref:tRNA-specific adenosine deaminase 2 n=1 Tax=Nematocida major TaxID=1912982 RepID=UPI00200844A5|nr:tRNA-specific adenosine deaminase 2 [Nematocida major]KAH9385850.1 tRNA-specific adenosine deaminase 2 [Nematocida major]
MEIAMQNAQKALEMEEVPIGCAILHEGVCIEKAHNLTNLKKDPLAHAEILCLERLERSLREKVDLYVTCEPCIMCLAVIVKMRIRRVFFACKNPRFGGITAFLQEGILKEVANAGPGTPEAGNTHIIYRYEEKESKTAHTFEAVYTPLEASLSMLKAFYSQENGRAPVEKRKHKSSELAKFFSNDAERE